MLADLSFLIGLILLFKGRFRLRGRNVRARTGRLMGLVLMAPTIITVCAVTWITFGRLSDMDIDQLEGNLTMDTMQNMLYDVLPEVAFAQTIMLIIALGIVLFTFLSLPQEPALPPGAPGTPRPFGAPPVAAPVQYAKVLTPAEVAAYLRISEFEVIALIDEGKLPAARIGSDYRIARSVVEDFLASNDGTT